MITLRAGEVAIFPAASVVRAVMLRVPSLRVLVVIDQSPLTSAVPVPTVVLPSRIVTVMPGSAVPVKVGVLSLVLLSVFDDPVSLAGSRSGVEGALGGVVSMVMIRAAEAGEMLPAASVALAVMLCV